MTSYLFPWLIKLFQRVSFLKGKNLLLEDFLYMYFTYIEPNIKNRRSNTGALSKKPPDPTEKNCFLTCASGQIQTQSNVN